MAQIGADNEELSDQFKVQNQFYEDFAEKLIIYDPLNREIKDASGQSMTVKQAELLSIIKALAPFDTSGLKVPISTKVLDEVEKLFSVLKEKCDSGLQDLIKQAEAQQADFKAAVEDLQSVKEYQSTLDFFTKYELLPNTSELKASFKLFKEKSKELIELAKGITQMDKECKVLY